MNEKCCICGGNAIFKIEVKFTEEDRVTYYEISYCYGCWKDSFGEYMIVNLDAITKMKHV